MVVVPLYDTLGPGAIRYIINTGEPTTAPPCRGPPAPSHSLSGYANRLTLIRSVLLSESTRASTLAPEWLPESSCPRIDFTTRLLPQGLAAKKEPLHQPPHGLRASVGHCSCGQTLVVVNISS